MVFPHEEPGTILAFIKAFHGAETVFTTGGCWWFSYILQGRFHGARPIYLPAPGHFVTDIDGRLYDATGDVTDEYADASKVPWSEMGQYDRNARDAVERDVILKLGDPEG